MWWIALFLFPFVLFGDWAEETLSGMALEEKVGQLFAPPACPRQGEEHRADWERLLKEFHVGCALIKQASPESQVRFLNALQESAHLPLLITADAENGLGMRMSETIAFPRAMTLGAMSDMGLIREAGREIARQAKRVGIHLNLAPVVDVNNNPKNPVIHMRSFGDNPHRVAESACAMIEGLQEGGVLACAKHFPGHGDTAVDSHCALPLLPHNRERLEEIELIPFRKAIERGVEAIMVGHLLIPALDSNLPASLSSACIDTFLRRELRFEGLIITDALNMGALASRSPEEIAFLARKAGADILLYGSHFPPLVNDILRIQIPKAHKALVQAYREGQLELADLDRSVLRILRAKEKAGLLSCRTVPLKKLFSDLHTKEAHALQKKLFQEAVTLVGKVAFPIDFQQTAYLSVNDPVEGDPFPRKFSFVFPVQSNLPLEEALSVLADLEKFDQIVVAVHRIDPKETFSGGFSALMEAVAPHSLLCLFASPYTLSLFPKFESILFGYEGEFEARSAVLNVLEGREPPRGQLPVALRRSV